MVLDASAVLAWMHGEPGFERVRDALPGACMSAVNFSEVLSRFVRDGKSGIEVAGHITRAGILVVPMDAIAAAQCAELIATTRALGLSFGDRACLALGIARDEPVLTADRAWSKLSLSVEVVQVRGTHGTIA